MSLNRAVNDAQRSAMNNLPKILIIISSKTQRFSVACTFANRYKKYGKKKFEGAQSKGKITTDPLCLDPSGNATLTGVP